MTSENVVLLEKSCLARAPFHVVPSESNVVWAGSKELRNELHRLVEEVRHDNLQLSHLGLLYGEYGSGKTHALKYLRGRLQAKGKSLVAYLAKPKVEKKGSFQGIAKDVIQQIGRNPLKRAVEPIVKYIRDETDARVREAVRSEPYENVNEFTKQKSAEVRRELQEELYPAFPEIFNLFEGLVSDNGEAWNYFAGKPAKQALAGFELNSPIEDDHDALRALAAIYTVLTTKFPGVQGTPVYDAAYLFIDEMEQFLELKADEYQSIRTGIRDLFNSCTEHFCLLLAATAENANIFHAILEEAIMVRVTAAPVHISSHDEVDDGVGFITELLQFARNGKTPPTPQFPFTKESLGAIVIKTTEPKTARKLIQNCNRVWQKCSSSVLAGGSISEDDVNGQHGLM